MSKIENDDEMNNTEKHKPMQLYRIFLRL